MRSKILGEGGTRLFFYFSYAFYFSYWGSGGGARSRRRASLETYSAAAVAAPVAVVAQKKVSKVADLPVIDLNMFLNRLANPEAAAAECAKVAQSLHEYGCLVVKDPVSPTPTCC